MATHPTMGSVPRRGTWELYVHGGQEGNLVQGEYLDGEPGEAQVKQCGHHHHQKSKDSLSPHQTESGEAIPQTD